MTAPSPVPNEIPFIAEDGRIAWLGREVPLSARQIAVVRLLIKEPGKFYDDVAIHHAFRGKSGGELDTYGCTRANIKRLRAAFRVVDPKFDMIETRHTIGWRWKP